MAARAPRASAWSSGRGASKQVSEQASKDVAYAHVIEGVVREIIRIPAGVPLTDRWHPDFARDMVRLTKAQTAEVVPGWVREGARFIAPPPAPAPDAPPGPTAADLLAQIAALQRQVEALAATTPSSEGAQT